MQNPIAKLVPQYFGEYPKPFQKLYNSVSLGPDQNKEEVKSVLWKAYEFGKRHHEGQKRLSGEPYFTHCIEVANTLAKWNMDTTTIVAGLLHDTLEDTDATLEDLTLIFGQELGSLVNGLTKLKDIKYLTRKEKQASNFMKMLLSVAQDLRVIIIKFADRLHNMKTIDYMPQIKKHRIAIETRDIYIPLAHRMGMSAVKSQLEDLVFKVLKSEQFYDIKAKVKSSKKQRFKFVNGVIEPIKQELNKYEISPNIYGRAKSYASIYNKMLTRNKSFDEIYDLYALRIIVQKPEQCYLALGLVHNLYLPVQDRFKDFIATPKTNGYQSIHTTVIGPKGKMVEIQIRTDSMEETAEIGVAAHWVYKDSKSSDIDKNVRWLRELLEILKDESSNPKEFMELLKIDLYDEEIFAFTPLGDLIRLPFGSTTVDFAFQVHTQVGMQCMGAKVNHLVVPLNTKIKNGDIVEILTSKKQNPSIGWQKFVVTTKARNEINRFIRKEMDENSIKLGEELLIKTLRRMKSTPLISEFKDSYTKFGYADRNSMLKAVGTQNWGGTGDASTEIQFHTSKNSVPTLRTTINDDGVLYNINDISSSANIYGDIGRFAGDVVAFYSSDERLKYNVQPIENPLDKISKLRGVRYNWGSNQTTYPEGTSDSGIIAQDVQKVLPELVQERGDGYLAVKHDRLVGLLIESIKEQQSQIDELKDEVKKLKGDN